MRKIKVIILDGSEMKNITSIRLFSRKRQIHITNDKLHIRDNMVTSEDIIKNVEASLKIEKRVREGKSICDKQ